MYININDVENILIGLFIASMLIGVGSYLFDIAGRMLDRPHLTDEQVREREYKWRDIRDMYDY